jgi:hypothetical protein
VRRARSTNGAGDVGVLVIGEYCSRVHLRPSRDILRVFRIHWGREDPVMPASRARIPVVLFLAAAAAVFAASPEQMSVKVKETQVRATPSYLGKILTILTYCDRVPVIEQAKGWARVRIPAKGIEGWVNIAALQTREIVLTAGSEDVKKRVSSGEVQLAGKGFNADTEQQYKTEQNLDYKWVNEMEKFVVPVEEIMLFLNQGGLTLEEAAR